MVIELRDNYTATVLGLSEDRPRGRSSMHSVQFYTQDTSLLDGLSRFVGAALGAGDAAIVIATEAHRHGLIERLKAFGFDVDLAIAQGRFVALDAMETLSHFMRDGWPDPVCFTDVIGRTIRAAAGAATGEQRHIAAFGEMVALLWAEGKPDAAIRLEQLWNELAEEHSFDLQCAYKMDLFPQAADGDYMSRVCAEHSHVIPLESYTSLAGEEERLRVIAILQQKARALETEIEEHKKVQESLLRREAELRAALSARDEFLSAAAHELKTPLTSLRGFAQLLLRDARRQQTITPERIELALGVIELQTGKLAALVSRLLDTAQIEAGRLRIEPVKTDLAKLVRGVVDQQHGCGRCTFVYDGPDHLEAVVDPMRLEQVVTNLLDNAVKFSPDGGLITIRLEQTEDGSIRLAVSDEGIGIPLERRESIFDRFNQAHSAHHLSDLGLGLYIVRQIIELHGGSIRVDGSQDRGSLFVLSLPPSTNYAQPASAL